MTWKPKLVDLTETVVWEDPSTQLPLWLLFGYFDSADKTNLPSWQNSCQPFWAHSILTLLQSQLSQLPQGWVYFFIWTLGREFKSPHPTCMASIWLAELPLLASIVILVTIIRSGLHSGSTCLLCLGQDIPTLIFYLVTCLHGYRENKATDNHEIGLDQVRVVLIR